MTQVTGASGIAMLSGTHPTQSHISVNLFAAPVTPARTRMDGAPV